jgi:hypothetical protein
LGFRNKIRFDPVGLTINHLKSVILLRLFLDLTIALQPSADYPLRVSGSPSAVQSFMSIIHRELGDSSILKADKIAGSKNEYGIHLAQRYNHRQLATRKDRFLCAMNCLLGDSSKNFSLKLVENQEGILIGDGTLGVIDVADVAKFESGAEGKLTAGTVLVHELYEQYYLQALGKLTPGGVTQRQLKKAHLAATQKESNLFDLLMGKTESAENDVYIYIEFTNRIDNSKSLYYAFHRNGNIDRIEKGKVEQ